MMIDPDCRDGKCGSCVGGPCEHNCHLRELMQTAENLIRSVVRDKPLDISVEWYDQAILWIQKFDKYSEEYQK